MFEFILPVIVAILLAFDLMLVTYVTNVNRDLKSEILQMQMEHERLERVVKKLTDQYRK